MPNRPEIWGCPRRVWTQRNDSSFGLLPTVVPTQTSLPANIRPQYTKDPFSDKHVPVLKNVPKRMNAMWRGGRAHGENAMEDGGMTQRSPGKAKPAGTPPGARGEAWTVLPPALKRNQPYQHFDVISSL